MVLTTMRLQSIVGIDASPSQAVRFFKRQPRNVSKHSSITPLRMRVEPDSVLVGSEQLAARFADHVAITATQALVSPNWFKCRGSFLDYSASVFSNVGSKLPHGMLEAVPGQIRDTIQRQVFVLGRSPDSSPNSSSGNVECIFSSPIPTLQPGLFFTDPWHKGRGCCTQLLTHIRIQAPTLFTCAFVQLLHQSFCTNCRGWQYYL